MPIFTLVLLLVSLLIFAHERGLFPEADVWDCDSGHFARVSVIAEFL